MIASRWLLLSLFLSAQGFCAVESSLVPFKSEGNRDSIVLKNDDFNETGGEAVLQLGFVKGEKAGVWVKVPETAPYFKVDAFRVLLTGGNGNERTQIFFQMGIANQYSPMIPQTLENAANVTAGPYWNDIPAQDTEGKPLPCVKAGQLVGAALEFTHDGAPSVARDNNGLSNAMANTLFAVPGGWSYSAVYGLTGDWILRVVGHAASEAECK